MSFSIRKRKAGEDGQNYLASVSDLMSGLLYVFILVLVVAVFKLQAVTVKAGAGFVDYAEETVDIGITSTRLVVKLADAIEAHAGIKVETQPENGVLRIPESAVSFKVSSDELTPDNREKLQKIGAEVSAFLRCFVPEANDRSGLCLSVNPNHHTLESIFIEGHTDNQQFQRDTTGEGNRLLSARRANAAYLVMVHENSGLRDARNTNGNALFSLSGYGADRPAKGHEHAAPTDDPANRRIELRFTLTQPKATEEMLKMLKDGKDVR